MTPLRAVNTSCNAVGTQFNPAIGQIDAILDGRTLLHLQEWSPACCQRCVTRRCEISGSSTRPSDPGHRRYRSAGIGTIGLSAGAARVGEPVPNRRVGARQVDTKRCRLKLRATKISEKIPATSRFVTSGNMVEGDTLS